MARGSVVKRKSGSFAIVYPAHGRQVWETVGKSRREAERVLTQRLGELREGSWKPARERAAAALPLTLAEYAATWLERQDPDRVPERAGRFARRRIARSTFDTYRGDLTRHVLPRLGPRLLSELRTIDVDDLIVALEREGKAPETIRNIIIPLRKMLGEAERQGLVGTNAASRCDLPPPQEFVGKEIPPDDCAAIRVALAALAPPDPVRSGAPDLLWPCAFDVALASGIRFGELRALRWRDVDRERRVLRIERAYSRDELVRPKSEAGLRAVPLFPVAADALTEMAARAFARGRYADDELVFATARGTPVHPSNFYRRVWAPALALAGLCASGYRWHDLRHTCVSRLVAAGADVALVQAIAGHADPRLTLSRYTHLRDARLTDAASRFAAAFVSTPLAAG